MAAVADLTEAEASTAVEAAARTRAAAVSVAVEALAAVRAVADRILTVADDRQFQVTAARMAARADILRVHPVHTITAVRAQAARTVTAVLVPARPAG